MSLEDREVINGFLIESSETLIYPEQEMVELGIFRPIDGTCRQEVTAG